MALTTNLISWYQLESDGADALGTNNLGTNTNNLFDAAYGKIGNGVYVNSNDSNHSVLNDASATSINFGTGNFSLSVWFNRQGAGHADAFQPPILVLTGATNYARAYICLNGTTGAVNTQFYDGSNGRNADYAAGITTAGWHHAVLTRSGGTITLYLDGSLVASDTGSFGTPSSANMNMTQIFIGSDNDVTDEFQGYVDLAGIWSRAITSDEVTELYNSGAGLAYPFVASSVPAKQVFARQAVNRASTY